MAPSFQTKHLYAFMVFLGFLAAMSGSVCIAASKPFDTHVEQGKKYVNESNYDQAIVEFKAAYALSPAPWLLINIGRAHSRADRPREALDYYNQALKMKLSPSDREEVQKSVDRALTKLHEQERQRMDEQRAADQAKLDTLNASPPVPLVAQPIKKAPFYKTGWFWGTVGGVVVVGLALGLGLGYGLRAQPSSSPVDVIGIQ